MKKEGDDRRRKIWKEGKPKQEKKISFLKSKRQNANLEEIKEDYHEGVSVSDRVLEDQDNTEVIGDGIELPKNWTKLGILKPNFRNGN